MAKRKRSSPSIRLRKTIFEVRYKAKLDFYDLFFSAAQKMGEYPHWLTDKLSITLKDYEKRCSLTIRHRNIGYDQDSDEIEIEEKNIKKAMNLLPEGLNISSFARLGFRRKYLITMPMHFNELKDILDVKLLSQDRKFREILPTRVDDFSCILDLSDDNSKFHINIGPIEKSQIPRWIDFDKENHLDPETKQKDYLKILEGYPDAAVFIDIDIYREEKEIMVKKAFPFYIEARKRIENMVISFNEYLL